VGLISEHWPLLHGLRLRRLARDPRSRHWAISDDHLPPLIPPSRVANMRSVHTTASVHSHWGGTSLPCLAFGTPVSSICSCVSFTLPLSCPPWLHGHYPFHRYYGDSDSCPAPFNTRAGILGSCSYASRHSISTHPMHPIRVNALFATRWLGLRLVLGTTGGSSDFVHYSQSHQLH